MLKILINSFKREFELKTSISCVYLYLNSYTEDFSTLNKNFLVSIYKGNISYLLSKLVFHNFELNKKFYLTFPGNNDLTDLNKFIVSLEKLFFSKVSH